MSLSFLSAFGSQSSQAQAQAQDPEHSHLLSQQVSTDKDGTALNPPREGELEGELEGEGALSTERSTPTHFQRFSSPARDDAGISSSIAGLFSGSRSFFDRPTLKKEEVDKIQHECRAQDEYKLQMTETRNIIVVGRSRTGKSTFVNMLKDFTYEPPISGLFAETKTAQYKTFCINPEDAKDSEFSATLTKKYTINIVDTPGLFEVVRMSDKSQARDNSFIRDCINTCLENEIARIHCVLIFLTVQGGINAQDVETVETFLHDFGSRDVRTCLVITHAEDFSEERMAKVVEELKDYPRACQLLEDHNVQIIFSGCVDPSRYTNEDDLVRSYYKTYLMRKTILQTIFDAPSEGAHLTSLNAIRDSKDMTFKLATGCKNFLRMMLDTKPDTNLAETKMKIDAHCANMERLSTSQYLLRGDPSLGPLATDIDLLLRDVAKQYAPAIAQKLSGPFTVYVPKQAAASASVGASSSSSSSSPSPSAVASSSSSFSSSFSSSS